MKKDKKIELEVRFLNIDYVGLVNRLKELGAKDLGEEFLTEVIFADDARTWWADNRFLRLRTNGKKTELAYKHHKKDSLGGAQEVELEVADFDQMKLLLELSGFDGLRYQEKKRHSFVLGEVRFDIDTWPSTPSYIEIEAPSETELKKAVQKLGLDWKAAVYENANKVLLKHYNIEVLKLRYFTFERIEEL